MESQDAADKSEDATSHKPTDDKKALDTSFLTQAIAIVRAKRWHVYQGHVSTQVALGGSNFVYFFWCVRACAFLCFLLALLSFAHYVCNFVDMYY